MKMKTKAATTKHSPMQKRLLLQLISILLLCSVVLSGFVSFIMNRFFENREKEFLTTKMAQLIAILDDNSGKKEYAMKLFIDDYLQRINYIQAALGDDFSNQARVNELLQNAQIRSFCDVDAGGTIVNSNQPNALGLNFYQNAEMEFFVPLIEGRVPEGYLLQLNATSILDMKKHSYLGVSKEGGGMFQVEVETDTIERYLQKNSIRSTIESLPTEQHEIIFVVDPSNDELIAITKNNKQEVVIENRVETMYQTMQAPQFITGNGNKALLYTQEYNGNIIGIATRYDVVVEPLVKMFGYLSLLIVLLAGVVGITLFVSLKKLVLNDLGEISQCVDGFCKGNKHVRFEECQTTELNNFSEQLNQMVEIISSINHTLDTTANYLGNRYGVYEYYADIDQLYYSSNTPDLLGMDEAALRRHIKQLLQQKEDTTYYSYARKATEQRYFRISQKVQNKICYGLIEDITEQSVRQKHLQEQVLSEKEKASRDPLTKLYNRHFIDEYFKQHAGNTISGAMILLDLDNFKTVNDTLGHGEGDQLLIQFAQIIQECFRSSDIKVRLGGDEFMILIPEKISQQQLETKFDSLLRTIRVKLKEYYSSYGLSTSCGGAIYSDFACDYETLYEQADAAMYEAKKSGKDGYCIRTVC